MLAVEGTGTWLGNLKCPLPPPTSSNEAPPPKRFLNLPTQYHQLKIKCFRHESMGTLYNQTILDPPNPTF